MTSIVGICNLAIGKLGSSSPITEITEDSRNGRAMNRVFEPYRDVELSSHPWTFAMARAQIPALSTAPAFEWSRAFPRPAGCLRVAQIGERYVLYEAKPSFELEGANILCDEASPLNLRYLQRVTNTGLFHPLFVDVLACRLAFEACKEITGSTELREQLWAERKAAVLEAKRQNAVEKPPAETQRGSWWQALHGRAG
jgi:hypothetical protein